MEPVFSLPLASLTQHLSPGFTLEAESGRIPSPAEAEHPGNLFRLSPWGCLHPGQALPAALLLQPSTRGRGPPPDTAEVALLGSKQAPGVCEGRPNR